MGKKKAGPPGSSGTTAAGASTTQPDAPFRLLDWGGFSERLAATVDQAKLAKALKMLRSERFRLFAEVQEERVSGVVRSQSSPTRVYACRLDLAGKYACCTQNLITCVVSHVSPCKHLLVLVVGLVRAGEIDPNTALEWLDAACRRGVEAGTNTPDKDEMTAIFLKYKGVQAGEIDWRPTETIPEDFYAM
jgi:hypothetical protein